MNLKQSTSQWVVSVQGRYPTLPKNILRWFLEAPIHGNGETWVLSKMWGTQTEQVLKELIALAPTGGFGFEPATPS
jgi:hypothetical protein